MSQSSSRLLAGLVLFESRAFTFQSGAIIDRGGACLIDPGLLPVEIDEIGTFVRHEGATPQSIALTHSHWDHVLGPERLPGIETIAHAAFVAERSGPHGRKAPRQIAEWEAGLGIERSVPFELPVPDRTFEGSMTVTIGNRAIELLHAPGHAPDHLVVHEPAAGLLWAADMLSDEEIPYVCHSLSAYERTLRALSTLDLAVLVPAHGRPAVTPREVRGRFDADLAYVADLRERAERAVRAGRSVAETVDACSDMRFANPEENERPHWMNVESAWVELGGEAPDEPIGWRRLDVEPS